MSESPESKFPRVAYLYQRTFGQGSLDWKVRRAQRGYRRSLLACLRQMMTKTEEPQADPQVETSASSSCVPESESV